MYLEDIKKKLIRFKETLTITIKKTDEFGTKHLLILISLTLVVFLFAGNFRAYSKPNKIEYKSLKGDNTKITFAGDVSPSGHLKQISKKYGHDIFYQGVKDIWKDSEITLVNLEASVLANAPELYPYSTIEKTSNLYLDVSEKDIKAMKDSGINLVSLANNHSMDYRTVGMLETLDILNSQKLRYIGAGKNIDEAVKPRRLKSNGQKIGIMAINDVIVASSVAKTNTPGIFNTSYQLKDSEIQKMVRANDFSIVFIHWGAEHSLKPDKEIKKLGRELIDMGVDLVIGSHPHVLLPIEKYNNGLIVYSLGNLVYGQNAGRTTDSVIANLYIDADKKFIEFVPLKIKNGVPNKTKNIIVTRRIFKELKKGLGKDNYKIEDKKLIVNF